jgi:hypothetical protein
VGRIPLDRHGAGSQPHRPARQGLARATTLAALRHHADCRAMR